MNNRPMAMRMPPRRLAAGLVAASMLTAVAALTPVAQAVEPVTVASGDGLAMTLSPTGAVTSVQIAGREVSGGMQAPLFSVRRVGGNQNLLPNPGFERDANSDNAPDDWRLVSGAVRPQWVSDQAHTGTRAIRFDAPSIGTSTTVQATISVKPNTYYTASGWIRSLDVKPAAATAEPATGPSPVRLKIQQLVGSSVVNTDQAYGYTDTVGWHRKVAGFRTEESVTSVRVLAQVVGGSGTVWFDDLEVSELFRPAWGPGRGAVTGTANGAAFDGTAGGMDIDATVAAEPDKLRVDGMVGSPTNTTTPFQLRVTVPLDAVGWNWWDNPRHSRAIETDKTYENLTRWNVQQTSRYPLNTVSDDRSALTVGLPLNEPRLARAEYADGRLSFTFDLGVSPATSIFGGARVPFTLVLYNSEPQWGYRAAIAKYYRIFPELFQRRTEVAREGGWFSQVIRSRLDDTYDDFGLGLSMIALGTGNDGGDASWGADYLPWDNARGIYATAYNHHWGYKHPNVDDPLTPTYADEIKRIRADAAASATTYADQRRRDRSVATLNSGARDNNNRLLYARYKGFMQHYENLNPLDGQLDWRTVSRTYQMEPALAEAERVGATLDALHLDSVSGMRRWGAADDYHQPHWANARYGLTFSYDSGRVVDRLAFGVAGQLQYVSDYAHDHGMFLSSNFNGSDARSAAWFGAAAIDYFGLERGLPDKAGAENDPYSTVDGYALFKRSLAAQRPMSTIDADCDLHSPVELAQRFEQTMLYGIYMGCGGSTSWSEELRAVFAQYTPLLREINAAGWEVVTRARSSNPEVQVERFGSLADDGAVWLAVHNPTNARQAYTVTVEGDAVGGLPASALEAEDRNTGLPVVLAPGEGGTDVSSSGSLEPHTTALVRLRPAGV